MTQRHAEIARTFKVHTAYSNQNTEIGSKFGREILKGLFQVNNIFHSLGVERGQLNRFQLRDNPTEKHVQRQSLLVWLFWLSSIGGTTCVALLFSVVDELRLEGLFGLWLLGGIVDVVVVAVVDGVDGIVVQTGVGVGTKVVLTDN